MSTPSMGEPGIPGACAGAAADSDCSSTFTASALRRMKSSAATITPTFTATTRSTNTVNRNVSNSTATSGFGARMSSRTTCGTSLMFQDTMNKMADRQQRGTADAMGASSRITRMRNTE